jgi:hypothetical protein
VEATDTCCEYGSGPNVFDAARAPVGSAGHYEVNYRSDPSITGCTGAEENVGSIMYRRGGCLMEPSRNQATLQYCDGSGVLHKYRWYGVGATCGNISQASSVTGDRCEQEPVAAGTPPTL